MLVGLFFGVLTYRQVYVANSGTIYTHIQFAERIQAGEAMKSDFNNLPHLGYFYLLVALNEIGLTFQLAATLVLVTAHLATAIIIYLVYRHFLGEAVSNDTILLFTFLVLIIGALYVPFFNPSPYFGQGSPNVHHNSTVIILKPISTLTFFLVVPLMAQNGTREYRRLIITTLLLALSVIVKPTFAIVFIPAVFIYLLVIRTHFLKRLWILSLIMLPTVFILLVQLVYYYQTPVTGEEAPRGLQLVFLDVWHTQTHSVPISLLLAVAFPLAISLFRHKSLIAKPYLIIAWLMTLIGAAQFAFIAETLDGSVHGSANWIGGYLMGLSALYIVAVLEFMNWLGERRRVSRSGTNTPFWVTLVLLSLHVMSGLVYDYVLLIKARITGPLQPWW
jgi:hypothetical protein